MTRAAWLPGVILLPLVALLPQPWTLFALIGLGAALRLRCLARSLAGKARPSARGTGCNV